MKYSVMLVKDTVFYGYLQHLNRTSWSKRTALKHAKYMISLGYEATLHESLI